VNSYIGIWTRCLQNMIDYLLSNVIVLFINPDLPQTNQVVDDVVSKIYQPGYDILKSRILKCSTPIALFPIPSIQ